MARIFEIASKVTNLLVAEDATVHEGKHILACVQQYLRFQEELAEAEVSSAKTSAADGKEPPPAAE